METKDLSRLPYHFLSNRELAETYANFVQEGCPDDFRAKMILDELDRRDKELHASIHDFWRKVCDDEDDDEDDDYDEDYED